MADTVSFRHITISGIGDPPPPNGLGLPVGTRFFVEEFIPGSVQIWELMKVPDNDIYVWRACVCDNSYYYYNQPDVPVI